jgi:hypothetical protein
VSARAPSGQGGRTAPWPSALALLVLGLLVALFFWQLRPSLLSASRLLLSPLLGNMEACLVQDGLRGDFPQEFQQQPGTCFGSQGSAAAMVSASLQRLGPVRDPALELGYTLSVPLLRYVQWNGRDWEVRGDALDRVVRTVAQAHRPVVLYLFATHFEVHSQAEQRLASDPSNLAWTPQGPLPPDHYLGARIFPWSVARQDNEITRVRRLVVDALAQRMCAAGEAAMEPLRAITVLGETHQLFPGFEAGMGFAADGYAVTDYSPASVAGFRQFLRQRYGDIGRLNARLQSDFASFDGVEPPSRNIRSQPLQNFFQHIDSYAGGTVPVSGWAHVPDAALQKRLAVAVFVDGRPYAHAPVHMHRQDVAQAKPGFLTSDVGWRADIRYPALGEGLHRIDVVLQADGRNLGLMATRQIAVMDRQQGEPRSHAVQALPDFGTTPEGVEFWVDSPQDRLALFYNPLVTDWNDYREQQVADYIQAFSDHIGHSCLGRVPRFAHQLNPHGNPSWDASRYAVDRSLQRMPGLALGVSLYGEDSYGPLVGQMLRRYGHTAYGITEFHPLVALDASRLAKVLDMHRRQGARFLSFFMEARPEGATGTQSSNEFSFDADNRAHGSDGLYRSLREVLGDRAAP